MAAVGKMDSCRWEEARRGSDLSPPPGKEVTPVPSGMDFENRLGRRHQDSYIDKYSGLS